MLWKEPNKPFQNPINREGESCESTCRYCLRSNNTRIEDTISGIELYGIKIYVRLALVHKPSKNPTNRAAMTTSLHNCPKRLTLTLLNAVL